MKRKVLIIKTGSTFPELMSEIGDFDDWIIRGMELPEENFLTVSVFENEALPSPGDVAGAIITGSHDMVTDEAEWMKQTARWLKGAVQKGVPTLGICFGHQLMAYALGGIVVDRPEGKEIGTLDVVFNSSRIDDLLFGAIEDKIKAQLSHAQSVINVPEGAVVMASSEQDPHQVIKYKENAWSVQFHPEFSPEALRAYIEYNRPVLEKTGRDVDGLITRVEHTPESAGLLKKIAGIIYA